MNFFCRILGHTWTHRTEDPKVSWNTGKDLVQLHPTASGEIRLYLQCHRCGERNDNPTREELKAVNN